MRFVALGVVERGVMVDLTAFGRELHEFSSTVSTT